MSATWESSLPAVIGAKEAKALERARGLRTVGDLVQFVPTRYLDPQRPDAMADLVVGQGAAVIGRVVSAQSIPMRNQPRRSRLVVSVEDDAGGRLGVVFFRTFGHRERLLPGARVLLIGTVGEFGGRPQMTHPDYVVLETPPGLDGTAAPGEGETAGAAAAPTEGLIGLYKEVKGMTSTQVNAAAQLALHALDSAPDPLPPAVAAEHSGLSALEAWSALHRPRDWGHLGTARERLRFAEAFELQTLLAQLRRRRENDPATPRTRREDGVAAAFDAALPFPLTGSQEQAGEEIAAELERTHPMHRLLQGDVGSGKTVVALRAMLQAVDGGGQAALLAPTEILAAQHHQSLVRMLGPLATTGRLGGGVEVRLLTGSMTTAQRRAVLLDLVAGQVDLVVGTHALLEDTVHFHDLALAVIDEQHRFGVEQRDRLRAKSDPPPHLLVMTATPIPRTVAMTVFGDMDVSTLTELPAGRQPVTTHVVPAGNARWMGRTWERVAEEVRAGRQAFVVASRIDAATEDPEQPAPIDTRGGEQGTLLGGGPEGEGAAPALPPALGVVELLEELRSRPELAGLRIDMVHGRMPAEAKEAVMSAFAAGEVDVLVATTVVEVGVDVPNASVMVIHDADRFGIAQLHQLRGRIGRGGHPGLCLLVTHVEGGTTRERLDAVAATTDGFELARTDLQLRREGDVLGAAQSGRSGLEHVRVLDHAEIITRAKQAATDYVEQDPGLTGWPELARAVEARRDSAEWLERS
ncbi:ATP-dependent DNA helicase RecG [Kytococcus aerolatus]|uniref:ATP-dependent DNA helicase RecG n=1 Tax=Kytococcus aerolatus TaxID=592308 RepID=A0A212U1Y0_9MICO|nr:ATP-dependent DNA helicase RecG [Kytococcus aerolatus]SNC72131.1 ATP-dependent DNA helicase RecG [Kytococcus aerolatus]